MKEKEGVRERILHTAMKLFYVQGIRSTGVNQIITESKVAKASFYKYFPSKDDLVKKCIMEYDRYIKNQMVSVVIDSTSFDDFVKKWIEVIKFDFQVKYRGCPVLEAGFQLDSGDEEVMELVQNVINGWVDLVGQFLSKMIKNQNLSPDIDIIKTSRRMVQLYEGASAMWRITNDMGYIDDLEFLMVNSLK